MAEKRTIEIYFTQHDKKHFGFYTEFAGMIFTARQSTLEKIAGSVGSQIRGTSIVPAYRVIQFGVENIAAMPPAVQKQFLEATSIRKPSMTYTTKLVNALLDEEPSETIKSSASKP